MKKFFGFDYDGYRLSSEGHSAIWALTEENGEPPESPVTVTREYRIRSEKKLPNGLCSVEVQFSTFGIIIEGDLGLQFKLSKVSVENRQIEVKCSGERCRINLEFNHFRVPPHPGKRAVEEWLSVLEKVQNTSEAVDRIRRLKSQVSSLK